MFLSLTDFFLAFSGFRHMKQIDCEIWVLQNWFSNSFWFPLLLIKKKKSAPTQQKEMNWTKVKSGNLYSSFLLCVLRAWIVVCFIFIVYLFFSTWDFRVLQYFFFSAFVIEINHKWCFRFDCVCISFFYSLKETQKNEILFSSILSSNFILKSVVFDYFANFSVIRIYKFQWIHQKSELT